MMPYNEFSPSSNEKHMGNTPLDKVTNAATAKYRAKYRAGMAKKANPPLVTKTKPIKKKKKFSFLRSLAFGKDKK